DLHKRAQPDAAAPTVRNHTRETVRVRPAAGVGAAGAPAAEGRRGNIPWRLTRGIFARLTSTSSNSGLNAAWKQLPRPCMECPAIQKQPICEACSHNWIAR